MDERFNDQLTLEELISEYERPFDLNYADDKYVMFADAKETLRPLFDGLRARIAELEIENENLLLQLEGKRVTKGGERP